MTRNFGFFAVLASALATGCAVDQEREVAEYRRVIDLPTASAASQPADAATPLTLVEALASANRHNEALAVEGENYLQALIEKKRTFAGFLPTVNLAGSYETTQRGLGASDFDLNGDRHDFEAGVGGEINLFRGFSDVAALKRDTQTIEQRRQLLLDLRESLLLDTAVVYYQVLRSERSAAVLEKSLEVQEERVRDMRGRQKAGVARPLDVSQTEAQASATRSDLISARRDVLDARTALAFLINAPVGGRPLDPTLAMPAELPGLETLVERAAVTRQDLLAAEAAARAARHDVDVAVGQYYPSVTLNLDYLFVVDGVPDESEWAALLRLNLPVFSAGRIEADVRDAWSRFRQALQVSSLTRRAVKRDLELTLQDLDASRRRVAELNVQVASAQQAYRTADQSYNAGLATNLERLASLIQLINAELELASEEFDQKVIYLAMTRATGELTTTVMGKLE